MAYTHRERVLTALNHVEPDRVPIDLMGHASMLADPTYFRLRDHLGLDPIPPVRTGTNANYYDERILEYLDIDYRRIFFQQRLQAENVWHEDGSYTDAWGIRFAKLGLMFDVVDYPLDGVGSVEEVDAYHWPSAEDMFTTEGLAEYARQLYTTTDYALVARNPLSYGFRERACMLMNMAEFMILLLKQPDVAASIVGHLLRIYKDVFSMFLDAVGPYVQAVEVGDDLAGNTNLLISPKMWRKFFKPAEKELFDLIHEKAPGAKIVRHSDGAYFNLIPDLIEIGVDVINPVQTSAKGMAPQRLKDAYGDKLAFHGAIETVEGDVAVEDVVAEVKARIDILGAGGGYVVSTCNHWLDVRPEVVIAVFETAREYSRHG